MDMRAPFDASDAESGSVPTHSSPSEISFPLKLIALSFSDCFSGISVEGTLDFHHHACFVCRHPYPRIFRDKGDIGWEVHTAIKSLLKYVRLLYLGSQEEELFAVSEWRERTFCCLAWMTSAGDAVHFFCVGRRTRSGAKVCVYAVDRAHMCRLQLA